MRRVEESKRRIAFVATREPTYSRVSITRRELGRRYQLDEYVSDSKKYSVRMLVIVWKLLLARLTGRLTNVDAVFVGFLAQPIFPLVRLLYRGPIVSDAYFSLYDALVNDKKKVAAGSLIGRISFWLDRTMLRRSELCFTDTQQHIQYMHELFNVPTANILRLWISAENEPLDEVKLWRKGETFQVFFWGGFIPLQGVDTIVRAAAKLRDENVCVTIFGNGQTFEECVQLKDKLSANNVEFAGWQTSDKIPVQARKSHLALGIFGSTSKAMRVIPNKAYEAMAMGLPLLTCRSKAIDELFIEDQHCLLVDAGNADQLAEKILWMRANHGQALEIAHQAKHLFATVCSPAKTAEIMIEAIDKLIDESVREPNQGTIEVDQDVASAASANT